MKNIGYIDRLFRIILATILFIIGYFWLGGIISMVLYVFAAILLFTSITGYCALYSIINISTKKESKTKSWIVILFSILFIVLLVGGVYASNFFTKKAFLEDFNNMNAPYKQTLFETGQNKRTEAVGNYTLLIERFDQFKNKYTSYHPYFLKGDSKFNSDIENISSIIKGIDQEINTGNLTDTHKKLENVRPILNDILKRNGLSMLSVSLVEFHDSMENVLDAANAKDAKTLLSTYVDADLKLKDVEKELNDESIQTIRTNLEDLKQLAIDNSLDAMSAKAAELKSSFVKVYLKKG